MDEAWFELVKAFGPSLVLLLFLANSVRRNTREHENAAQERMRIFEMLLKEFRDSKGCKYDK